jgi:aspartyl-tRNA(Asn)/glutamyl-tRNA(Gln) amidotransferase subunit B
MASYKPTIGLEIHVELKTKTKMFCDCLNDPLEKNPNENICPVCTAQPGSLPVINRAAVESVIKAGLALNCQINKKSWFERKNYFYPDLPKGYQISQYEAPLCKEGYLEIDGKKVKIRRIHLEEDTGKLVHSVRTSSTPGVVAIDTSYSLVDYNRAGVPLMELVTEPDIISAAEAKKFAEELQLIFRYLGISDADMEKGQMRVEANISLDMGTKVEVKNLNSFKSVEKAIEYELERQKGVLEGRGEVIHETRGWNDAKQETFSQRTKETSDDYRYFPEPDLPPMSFSADEIEKLGDMVSELPAARRKRFKEEYPDIGGLAVDILVIFKNLGDFFECAASELRAWFEAGRIKTDLEKIIKLSANYIITEFPKYVPTTGEIKITPENFAELIYLTFIGEISSSGAQEVLREMFINGSDPSQIIESKNLKQMSDESELEKTAELAIKNNPQAVEDYEKGKETAMQFLVGQVMRETKGKANPKVAADLIRKVLKK